jgi:predicted helicase
MIPRLPILDGFADFVGAGRALAKLHLGYETVERWPLEGPPDPGAEPKALRVEIMRFGGTPRTMDRSAIVVNPWIVLSSLPDEVNRYAVNGRTPLEWVIDRYQVKLHKDSGIRNDPNDRSDDPRYLVHLVARFVRVSIESVSIIETLPPLGPWAAPRRNVFPLRVDLRFARS